MIRDVVTMGFGSFGSIRQVVTMGYMGTAVIPGPFRSVAGQAWTAGSDHGQTWEAGSATGQNFTPGSEQGQVI